MAVPKEFLRRGGREVHGEDLIQDQVGEKADHDAAGHVQADCHVLV